TVNSENSAITNFSLWSRSARGALKTLAPCRSASESSHVLATYSMSKGGSLRMSTASNSKSGRSSVSCARYQSSSLSASEIRVLRPRTDFFPQYRSVCPQTKTACPRAWAARIIATVVSLYALSSSGGSMMKRRIRLLALRDHVFDRRVHLGVGERGIARLGRHGAFALGHGLEQHVHALLDARRPGRLVAELGRSGEALRVAGEADFVVHRLAVGGGGRLALRRGFRSRGLGRDVRLSLLSFLFRCGGLSGLLGRRRLLELGA